MIADRAGIGLAMWPPEFALILVMPSRPSPPNSAYLDDLLYRLRRMSSEFRFALESVCSVWTLGPSASSANGKADISESANFKM